MPFGRAAQAHRITQPALSNAIRALESPFSVTIVRRVRQYEAPARELAVWPEQDERYFLVQRTGTSAAMAFGPALAWVDAAALPLVLLTPGMRNRQSGDVGFAVTGRQPESVIETDSVLALLVTSALHTPGLLACPLCSPTLCTMMAFLSHGNAPLTLTLRATSALPAK